MKKIKFLAAALLLMGAAAFTNLANASDETGTPHACVLVADTPTHGSIDCIGDGSVCKVVGDCLVN